jgi:hypothetical protein
MSWGYKLYDLLEGIETLTKSTLTEAKFENDMALFKSEVKDSLDEVSTQLKILNIHLSVLTNENITEGDVE